MEQTWKFIVRRVEDAEVWTWVEHSSVAGILIKSSTFFTSVLEAILDARLHGFKGSHNFELIQDRRGSPLFQTTQRPIKDGRLECAPMSRRDAFKKLLAERKHNDPDEYVQFLTEVQTSLGYASLRKAYEDLFNLTVTDGGASTGRAGE